jgi:cysteine desulfuration protein SufE
MNQTFPPPLENLLEEFAEIPDWDERYEYLIELGREVPPLEARHKIEQNRVRGCLSTVWLVMGNGDPANPRIEMQADSDSLIVKGLIAVLFSLFDGKAPSEVLATDVDAVFGRLGLAQHLSPNRRNGLYAMVKRIRELASQFAARTRSESSRGLADGLDG